MLTLLNFTPDNTPQQDFLNGFENVLSDVCLIGIKTIEFSCSEKIRIQELSKWTLQPVW